MIRLDLPDGMRLWVRPDLILLFFDDPELDYDSEHTALVKLDPRAFAEATLVGVTQSATEIKHMIYDAQFNEVPDE